MRVFHHAATGNQVGIAWQTEQCRHFMAQVHGFFQNLQILWRTVIGERDLIAAACIAVIRRLHERFVVRVFETEQIVALVVTFGAGQVGCRHALQFCRSECQLLVIVADITREFLAQLTQFVEDLFHPGALFRGQRDAGVVEAVQDVLTQFLLYRVARLDGFEAGVQLFALQQVGSEFIGFNQAGFGGAAYFCIRRNVVEDIDRTLQVFQGDLQIVPFGQHFLAVFGMGRR